jgi:hypothetical protein
MARRFAALTFRRVAVLMGLVWAVGSLSARASDAFTVQGLIRNSEGAVLLNGNYPMRFRVKLAGGGGTTL